MRVIACPDKFGGTLTAHEVTEALTVGFCAEDVVEMPMSDGGDGFLRVVGDALECTASDFHVAIGSRWERVPVRYTADGYVVVEAATVLGRLAWKNRDASLDVHSSEPLGALLAAILAKGCRGVHLGLGGTLCLDGGRGMDRRLTSFPLEAFDIQVYCDLNVAFVDTVDATGLAKGYPALSLADLRMGLEQCAADLEERFGRSFGDHRWTGAGGGVAGYLLCRGASLKGGAEAVGGLLGLKSAIEQADLVITGEGVLDDFSFAGKVVGYVTELAHASSRQPRVTAVVRRSLISVQRYLDVRQLPMECWGNRCAEQASLRVFGQQLSKTFHPIDEKGTEK